MAMPVLSQTVAPQVQSEGTASQPAPLSAGADPTLDAKSNSVRDALFEQILAATEAGLKRFPPDYPMSQDRHSALLALDGICNDPYVTARKPLQEYYHRRFKFVIDQIAAAKVAPGQAIIWHTYNMGFVVKTSSVTVAFDLIAPSHLGDFQIPADLMREMVRQCDVLFISHLHQDHADPEVARLFVEAGKPIVGPTEELLSIDPIYNRVLPLKPDVEKSIDIKLARGNLNVWIFPGKQTIKPNAVNGATEITYVQNNVYVVRTPEGYTIAHCGDQNDEASWKWIDQINKRIPHIDTLIFNAWANPIARYIKGFNPSSVIMAHCNELGHLVPARYPYWKAVNKGEKARIPFYVMTWGESIQTSAGVNTKNK